MGEEGYFKSSLMLGYGPNARPGFKRVVRAHDQIVDTFDAMKMHGGAVRCRGMGNPNSTGHVATVPQAATGSVVVSTNRAGATLTLDGAQSATVPASKSYTYKNVAPGTHQIRLEVVHDGESLHDAKTVSVSAGSWVSVTLTVNPSGNQSPVANAGPDIIGFAGTRYIREGWNGVEIVYTPTPISISLQGTDSSDPDGAAVTCLWTQKSGPAGNISEAATATPSFIPVKQGVYEFSLVVNDGFLNSPADSVKVTVHKPSGRLVFSSGFKNKTGTDIFIMNADGSGLRQVTDTLGSNTWPSWFSDGNKIAFTCDDASSIRWICTMNIDGTEYKQIATGINYTKMTDVSQADTLDLTGTRLFSGGTALASLYTQQPRFAIEQWNAQHVDWGAAAGGSVDMCATAYSAQGGGYNPAQSLDYHPYCAYEKITAEPVADNIFTDTYLYDGAVWSYAETAVDIAGNTSMPSVTASVPASSLLVTDAQLTNAPGASPTGYAQPGEDVLVDVTFIPQVDPLAMGMQFRLANKSALNAGAPLQQTLIGGPIAIQPDPQTPGRYTAAQTLSTITDAAGRTAAELALVMSLAGWENITSARGLKGGVAPVRSVALANAARPGKTNARVGEPVSITVQGNSGLALSAALLDPASGEPLAQPTVSLVESPPGSGAYEGQALLTGNTGGNGQPLGEIIALVSDALERVDPGMPSINSLDLLPALNLSGAVSAQPDWFLPGWSLNSLASLANNGAEQLTDAAVTVSLKSDGGQAAYAVTQTHTLTPGASLPDLDFSHGPVFLAPGAYTASLDVDVDGFIQTVAQTQIEIVPDLVDGTLVLHNSSYLSGESMAVTLTANNVSGRTLGTLVLELRLYDEAGQALATVPAGTLASWPSGGAHTAVVDVPVPSGITGRAYYRLALLAALNGNEDVAAEKLVPVLPEQILVSGLPIPDHVIQYQEPLFNFSVTNQTRGAIADGLVTGEVHTVGWQPGEVPLASFSATMRNLAARDSLTLTSNFSPVGAVPGEYRIVIFTQADSGAPRVKAMETPLWVESCEP